MLAERMNHLGTETAFEVLARANALEAEGREIINLGIGQPDFQTPEHIVEAAIKAPVFIRCSRVISSNVSLIYLP